MSIGRDRPRRMAWLWLAALAHKDEEKRYCLDRALELNPEGAARDALVDLTLQVRLREAPAGLAREPDQ